jgi:hypothetical protein
MKVYVIVILNEFDEIKHLEVFSTKEKVKEWLWEYVKASWPKWYEDSLPDDPDKAIKAYFYGEAGYCDNHTIEECVVDGALNAESTKPTTV